MIRPHSGVQPGRSSGYTVVAASFVVQGTIVGAIFTYGVFFDVLHAELGWSRAVISAGSALTSLVMGVGAMAFGRVTDKAGPRGILGIAAIVLSLGYLLMSRMSAPWHLFVAYPLLVGIAFGTHDVVTLSTVARWFETRLGRMSAIVKAGTGTGQVIGPTAAAALISMFGWRNAYLWIAAVTGPLVFIASRFMRRPPHDLNAPREDRLPAAAQNGPAGSSPPGADAPPDTSRRPAPDTPRPPVPSAPSPGARELMRRPEFVRLCIAQASFFFCAPTIIVHAVPYATDLGIERTVAAGVLSAIGGISIVGRLVIGSAIDRVGGRATLLICYAILVVAFVLLLFAGNVVLLYLFAIVYGFAHGGAFTSVSPLVAELFGTRVHGLLYGTIVFVGTLAGAIGPIFAGGLFDMLGTYRPAFLVMIVVVLVGLVSIASIRPRGRGIG